MQKRAGYSPARFAANRHAFYVLTLDFFGLGFRRFGAFQSLPLSKFPLPFFTLEVFEDCGEQTPRQRFKRFICRGVFVFLLQSVAPFIFFYKTT